MIAAAVALAFSAPKESAFFRLEERAGRSAFRAPNGQPFWSFGVCCTGPGFEPQKVDPKNPGYAGLQHYPDEKAWAKGTAHDLRSWGFNSLGGWSDVDLFKKAGVKMPYFVVLHLGAYDKAPWNDLFADQMQKAIDGAAKAQIPKVRDDPNLVGYFTDNELGWWTDTLFPAYIKMPAASKGRKTLMRLVRSHYRGDFNRLQKDWMTSSESFAVLEKRGDLTLRPGGNGIKLVDAWTSALATRYYSMVHRAVRRHDPRHLILGDRYAQYYDLPVARAAAPYVDGISTNLGAEWTDGGLSRFFLESLHKVTKKPLIVTEFYMAAMENRSGNRNSSGGFPIVQTQNERAAAFRRNVAEMAARPYVVGAHWFQFYDEPTHGRGDGENYNMGLVDIHGQAYEKLTEVSAALDPARRHAASALTPILNTAPPAPADPMKGLKDWRRERALVAPSSGDPFGDLYVVWKPDALYLGMYAMDYMDESLYVAGRIPQIERPTWTVRRFGKPFTVRYGGKDQKATVDRPDLQIAELPGLKFTTIVRVPGKFSAGKRIDLKVDLASHSRAEQMGWQRSVRLIP
ncbi:hypothetical protein EON81_08285 [bacterium]|nr:MAG: hypothetical protein EON81_08285 [bacterium]